jgi:hypothetical protein
VRKFSVRVTLLPFVCLFSAMCFGQTWVAGTGTATITGTEQGPVYPCGRRTCPTYDAGQIKITVNGFVASVSYANQSGKNSTASLALSLAGSLNSGSSPVIASLKGSKITLTSKTTGASSNYALSTVSTYSTQFKHASFTAALAGVALNGGKGVMPAPMGTLIVQASNNTSACSSPSDMLGNLLYCGAMFGGSSTSPLNTSAETLTPNSPAGHVSDISLHQLMYAGWTGRMICEYQPWFGNPQHISVGYNENNANTVAAQNSAMLTEGCDINLVDFYGALSPSQTFNLATTNLVFSDLNARSGQPLKFGILEDKGSLVYSCPTNGGGVDQTACLTTALISDMDYINQNYATSNVYWTDGGQPVVAFFVTQSLWSNPTPNWDAIWTAMKAHTDAYTTPFKFVFQYGAFTTSAYDNGRFGWMQPPAFSATNQLWWGSSTAAAPTYLDSLYNAGIAHPSQLTVGALYKGFDDYMASWGGNRVIAQQCGQVLLNTAKEVGKFFGGTHPQVPYMQVITWNDYEEGTEVESGIDNCYTLNASLSGNVLSWTLVASDPLYATPATIHHFNVYFADASGNLYPVATNLPTSTNSLNLSTVVPSGTWTMYVEMVGQPLVLNRISNGMTYIH